MKSLILGIALSYPFIAVAHECHLDDTLNEYQQRVGEGRTFAAQKLLEQANDICAHPRLLLELGEIHLEHGRPDQAQEVWEQALQDPTLPESVVQKVKLRIVQLRLDKPKKPALQAVITAEQEWDKQFISGLSVTGVYRKHEAPFNFAGFPMTHGIFAKFSGNARYLWSSNAISQATLWSAGWQANAKPMAVSVGPVIHTLSDEVTFGLDSSITFRTRFISLKERLEYSFSNEPHEWHQDLQFNFETVQVKTGVIFSHFESELLWTEFDAGITGKGKLRPELDITFEPEEELWRSEVGVRFFLAPRVWVNLETGANLNEEPQWYVESSLSWRPF